jgi:long-chain fatty acid transport protein
MRRRGASTRKALAATGAAVSPALALLVMLVVLLVLVPARPARAAGFAISEQSAKATGMADAMTAQSDDPSTIYYNVGGMAFFDRATGSAGSTYITETRASFHGAAPYPGPNDRAAEKHLAVFPPHLYWIQPLTHELKVGLGVETPFGLETRWRDPDTFAGRYLSTLAAIKDFDINPAIAYQVTPEFGIGVGGIARISKVTLERDVPQVDPFTFNTVNVAKAKLESNYDNGYGFNVGFLHKPASWFSWGATYRSAITVNYTGSSVLFPRSSGDPVFDAILPALVPYNTDIPVKTQIKFPATAALGFAVKAMPDLSVELDGNWNGWKRFDAVPLTFPTGQLPSSTIVERWKDAYAVRVGLEWASSPVWKWRLGYVWDQTPQPEQTVNPLLPDANRNGVTVGAGWNGAHTSLDLGVMYLFFADRTRTHSFSDDPLGPFFGTYSTRALLVSLTLGFHQ